MRVHALTITPVTASISQLPPPPTVPTLFHARDSVPSSDMPLKKRARLDSSGIVYTPPPAHYTLGESSRGPAQPSMYSRITDQQDQIDRIRYQVEEIVMGRIDDTDDVVEDLVQGRVALEDSYHGLEARRAEDHERISHLRDEMPELRDMAQASQDE